jgi:hypothetical protein
MWSGHGMSESNCSRMTSVLYFHCVLSLAASCALLPVPADLQFGAVSVSTLSHVQLHEPNFKALFAASCALLPVPADLQFAAVSVSNHPPGAALADAWTRVLLLPLDASCCPLLLPAAPSCLSLLACSLEQSLSAPAPQVQLHEPNSEALFAVTCCLLRPPACPCCPAVWCSLCQQPLPRCSAGGELLQAWAQQCQCDCGASGEAGGHAGGCLLGGQLAILVVSSSD